MQKQPLICRVTSFVTLVFKTLVFERKIGQLYLITSSELNHSRTRKMGARETMQECFISANSKENSTVFKPEIKKFDHDGHKTQLKSSICSV